MTKSIRGHSVKRTLRDLRNEQVAMKWQSHTEMNRENPTGISLQDGNRIIMMKQQG